MAAALAQVPCESRETLWAPSPLVYLRLADGSPWGWVERSICIGDPSPIAHARFEIDGGAAIEVSHAGITVEASVRELPVYSRTALPFGGGFTSSSSTKLIAAASSDGGAMVTPAPRDDLRALRGWTPVTVPCDSLRLVADDGPSFVGGNLQKELPLFDRRGAETFLVAPGAQVDAVRGSEVVVRLSDGASIVGTTKGWAPPSAQTISGSIEPVAICCRGAEPPPRDCWFDLQLWVAYRARRERVGVMQKGVFFDVVSTDGDWVTISLRDGFFALSRDWTLVVRATDLEACSRNEPERGAHLETFPR